MEIIAEDILLVVISFSSISDIQNLSKTSKTLRNFCLSNSTWIDIANRDCPYLGVTSRQEYICKNPMYVSNEEIDKYISGSSWAQKWIAEKCINRNGKEEHRYKAYVTSIVTDIIRVEHYNALKAKFPQRKMDWKIGINIIVDDLIARTEEEEKELREIRESNKYFGRING
jgi:hypothetical protein